MITIQDLNEAIAECNGKRNPTSCDCVKLAAYLIIKNEMEKKNSRPLKDFTFGNFTAKIDAKNSDFKNYSYSQDSTETPLISLNSGTEFAKVLDRADLLYVLEEVDELLTALHSLNPRIYSAFMTRIKN